MQMMHGFVLYDWTLWSDLITLNSVFYGKMVVYTFQCYRYISYHNI